MNAEASPRIAAVVLAAGRSLRMGCNKLLADLHGRPLLLHVLEQVQASGVDAIMVVSGHMAAEVQAALAGRALGFVHNSAYAAGLSTSIRTGIAAVQDFDAAFICLGDMPLLRADDMQRMMAAFNVKEGRRLVAPVQGGRLGNPVLWGQDYFPRLMALEGDKGARALLEAQRDAVFEINVTHDGIMLDADTPEALAIIRKR